MFFRYLGCSPYCLPLDNLIYRIDVVYPFVTILVSLVEGIYPQVTWFSLWFLLASCTNCFSLTFGGLLIERDTAPVGYLLLQVIDMRYRDINDVLVLLLTILPSHTFKNLF